MATLRRTTLTIPQDILQKAKLLALQENKALSELVREALIQRLKSPRAGKLLTPASVLGRLKIGAKKLYKKRSEIYG